MVVSAAKGRTEQTFITRIGTFNLPTLVKEFFVKSRFHLTPIVALGPLSAASFVERDHGLGDSEPFTAKTMVVLAIIRGIRKHGFKVNELTGLHNGRGKLGRIVTGPAGHDAGGKQMGVTVTDGGYFGPFVSEKAFVPSSVNVVSGCVTSLKTGCIHGRSRMGLEHG